MVYCGFTYSGPALLGVMHSILETVREMSRRYFLFSDSPFRFQFSTFQEVFFGRIVGGFQFIQIRFGFFYFVVLVSLERAFFIPDDFIKFHVQQC